MDFFKVFDILLYELLVVKFKFYGVDSKIVDLVYDYFVN